MHGEANKSLAQEVQRSPPISAHLLPHSHTACTQSEEGQEETPSAGPGLHQETSQCHSYQQDPAPPPDDRKSQAQRGVSPQEACGSPAKVRGCPCNPALLRGNCSLSLKTRTFPAWGLSPEAVGFLETGPRSLWNCVRVSSQMYIYLGLNSP